MSIKLNQTIVHACDRRAAAEFFAGILGLQAPQPFGPFLVVHTDNEASLAFLESEPPVRP